MRGRLPAARGTGTEPVPGGPAGPPREPLRALRDPFGSPGPPFGARARRFLSRSDLWLPARPIAGLGDHTLRHLASQRFPAIAGASALAVFPGLPDLEPSNTKAFLPGADRCHAGCWIRAPRRKQRRWQHSTLCAPRHAPCTYTMNRKIQSPRRNPANNRSPAPAPMADAPGPTRTAGRAEPAGLTRQMRLGSAGAPPESRRALPWAMTSPAAISSTAQR